MVKKTQIPILILVGGITLLSLFICFKIFNVQTGSKFETLGQLGDFYGGILGTIITFVSIYFIYQTYQQQREQLDIAKKDSDFEIINKLYNDLLQEINSIQYRKAKGENGKEILHVELHQGMEALYNFDSFHWHNPNSVINHLNSICLSFEQLIAMTKKVKYKYQDMKDIMMTKVYFLFYAKIIWPANSLYSKREEYQLTSLSSDAVLFFGIYEKLTKESIDYLFSKKRIGYPKNAVVLKIINN